MSVICIGDALVDLLARVPELPDRGGATWSPPPLRSAGGTAANVASGLAKLGIRTALAGRVGEDPDGDFLIRDLSDSGVDVSLLMRDPDASTGVAFGMVEPDGERTFVACALGAAYARLCPEDLREVCSFGAEAVFVTGLALLEEPSRSTVLETVRDMRERKAVYFDPNLRQPGSETDPEVRAAMFEMAGMSDTVLAGENEIAALDLIPSPEQAYVIKSGAQGARLERKGEIAHHLSGHEVEVVDATGAGDTFDAAFIAGLLEGRSEREALEFANAAAALSVTESGARAMPDREDAVRLINGRQ